MISRQTDLPEHYSTREMAADYSALLNRLCLTVTTPEANETLRDVVGGWMALA